MERTELSLTHVATLISEDDLKLDAAEVERLRKQVADEISRMVETMLFPGGDRVQVLRSLDVADGRVLVSYSVPRWVVVNMEVS